MKLAQALLQTRNSPHLFFAIGASFVSTTFSQQTVLAVISITPKLYIPPCDLEYSE